MRDLCGNPHTKKQAFNHNRPTLQTYTETNPRTHEHNAQHKPDRYHGRLKLNVNIKR